MICSFIVSAPKVCWVVSRVMHNHESPLFSLLLGNSRRRCTIIFWICSRRKVSRLTADISSSKRNTSLEYLEGEEKNLFLFQEIKIREKSISFSTIYSQNNVIIKIIPKCFNWNFTSKLNLSPCCKNETTIPIWIQCITLIF